MAIGFEKALGDMPAQLALYGKRSSLLASNIANADTPNFKARDIDFRAVLARAGTEGIALQTTQPGHIGGAGAVSSSPDPLYRIPTQASLDGNTVNTEIEQAEFAENAVRYQSTLTFLSGRFQALKLAIKGE
jgi:flagellar basal-body rod protein FlgB